MLRRRSVIELLHPPNELPPPPPPPACAWDAVACFAPSSEPHPLNPTPSAPSLLPKSQSLVCPWYTGGFHLRTAGHDVPTEGKSAFALEADEIRALVRDSTARSLVMVDELGRGTSSRDGAAVAGALLEELDRRRVTGVRGHHNQPRQPSLRPTTAVTASVSVVVHHRHRRP